MRDRTGGELIQDFLGTYEIPFVFGNPGTTETTFLAAIAASKATYVLSLHESSAVGIAAATRLSLASRPSSACIPIRALANGMFNMRNALMAGVPLSSSMDSRTRAFLSTIRSSARRTPGLPKPPPNIRMR